MVVEGPILLFEEMHVYKTSEEVFGCVEAAHAPTAAAAAASRGVPVFASATAGVLVPRASIVIIFIFFRGGATAGPSFSSSSSSSGLVS